MGQSLLICNKLCQQCNKIFNGKCLDESGNDVYAVLSVGDDIYILTFNEYNVPDSVYIDSNFYESDNGYVKLMF